MTHSHIPTTPPTGTTKRGSHNHHEPSRVPGQPRRPLLNGRRAMLADLRSDREGVIIAYPSDGEFATVRFDGDPEPITVHKSRVLEVLPGHTCEQRTDGAGSAYFTTSERCPACR